MKLDRRQMLQLSAGTAAALATGISLPRASWAQDKTQIPVGLELWSVRHQCENDLPNVLAAVGKMGYTSVELAHSYYGHDAQTWRELLDKNGLKSCGMHMGLPALQGDQLAKTVEIHKVLGTPYLIVASLPKKSLATIQAITQTAKQFNELADQLKPHGMRVGYHCHGGDFEKVEGQIIWEVFGKNTQDDVILQLDIGNCLGGGGDPLAMLKAFPGRSTSVHLKDYGGKAEFVFGEGTVIWDEVFQICETTGGVKQYVIEEEGREGPAALAAVRRALQNYRRIRKLT